MVNKQGRPRRLRAGASQVEITPGKGVLLAGGGGRYRPAQLVADPLFAKVLVLEQDGRKLCAIALDLTVVMRPYTERIRRLASETFGYDSNAVMVHATMTIRSIQNTHGFAVGRMRIIRLSLKRSKKPCRIHLSSADILAEASL